jgi:hypothetical protein
MAAIVSQFRLLIFRCSPRRGITRGNLVVCTILRLKGFSRWLNRQKVNIRFHRTLLHWNNYVSKWNKQTIQECNKGLLTKLISEKDMW